jgi:hypothetical protein
VPTNRSDELKIQNDIRLQLGADPAVRLWRNNTGALKDQSGRLVRYGLCQGSSDLIGLRQVTITPEMVGQTLAVFTAIEVKDRGRATPDQQAFISAVSTLGGFAGVAHSVSDARAILRLNNQSS